MLIRPLVLAWLVIAAVPLFGEPAYTVTYLNLTGETNGEKPATAVASIDAAPGLSAVLGDQRPDSWFQPPPKTEPDAWLSLVKIKTGLQCDFFLFQFADRNATVAYAGRRPSRVREVQYYYSVPPGPDQIPENAIRETATDFIFRYSNEVARARPPLQVAVEPWPEAPGQVMSGEPGGAPVRADLAEVMAFAAAFEAGFRPTRAEADTRIRLSVREEMGLFYACRAVDAAGKPVWTRRNIPKEAFYNHLVRLFFRMREQASIREATAFAGRDAIPLALAGSRTLVLAGDTGIRGVDTASGRILWRADAAPKETPRYAVLQHGDEAVPYRIDGKVVRVDPTSGTVRVLAPAGVSPDGAFDVNPAGDLARLEGGTLEVFRDGSLAWAVDGAFAGNPAWGEGLLYAFTPAGEVVALDPAAKKDAWRTPAVKGASPRLTVAGGLVLAETDAVLAAFDPKTGTKAWEHPTGDVLADPPALREGRVFLATKRNTLAVLDAKTGTVKASREWPAWVLGVRVAGPVVACVDIRCRLTLLKPDDLSTVREVAFPWDLRPGLLAGEAVPVEWALAAGGDEPAEMVSELGALAAGGKPAILCQDKDGFVYAVAIP